jgi:hypothetical protein
MPGEDDSEGGKAVFRKARVRGWKPKRVPVKFGTKLEVHPWWAWDGCGLTKGNSGLSTPFATSLEFPR